MHAICWHKKEPNLDPITREFINKLNATTEQPLYKLSPEKARKFLDNLQKKYATEPPNAVIEDVMLQIEPKIRVSVRIVRPAHYKNEILPVAIYAHGGGWILGNYFTHDRLIREIANGANIALIFVNYALSPEAQYPVALEQIYNVLKYVYKNAKLLNIDNTRIALVGDSVGGNMATIVALLNKKRKGPNILLQILFYPVTDASFDYESYEQFKDGPWLTRAAMKWFWDAYEPNANERKKPTLSPINASMKELSGLPEALIITDENDVLRDQGEAYAHKLTEAGVKVTAIRCLNAIHDFVMLNAIQNIPATKTAIGLAIFHLKKVFYNTK